FSAERLLQARGAEEGRSLVAELGSGLVKRILVVGAAGMIGRKLPQRLAQDGKLDGEPIGAATLHDIVAAQPPAGLPFEAKAVASDLSMPGEAEKLAAERPQVIFHLAAIVSGEAEADFEK